MAKKSTQKFKYIENKESFENEIKSIFLYFQRDFIKNKLMFLEGESPTLKTFNNYTIIMTNNSDKIGILWAWCFCLCCLFLVNSAGCSGEFHVVFKHFENLENFIWNILKKTLRIPWRVRFSPLKTVQSFQNSTVQIATINKAMFKFWSIFHIPNLWYSLTRDNSFLQIPSQSLTGKQKSPLPQHF